MTTYAAITLYKSVQDLKDIVIHSSVGMPDFMGESWSGADEFLGENL